MRVYAIHDSDGTISAIMAAPANEDIEVSIRGDNGKSVTPVEVPDLRFAHDRLDAFEQALVDIAARYRVRPRDGELIAKDASPLASQDLG